MLPSGGSCLLGSMNLTAFVHDGYFDFSDFVKSVRIAVRALNDVLIEGQPRHPLNEQKESVAKWRQIGLGVMSIADMLIKLGIRYGSDESVQFCDNVAKIMAMTAIDESCAMAEEMGAFPGCVVDELLQSEFLLSHVDDSMYNRIKKYGLYNSQLLTIAPTGTLSTMIGVSGGIEPIYANYYTRLTKSLHNEDVEYKVYTPIVKTYMDEHGIEDDADLPDFFVTAQTLDWHERIKMQGTWQNHIDASISSTVNVPNSFTVEEVEEMYTEAYAHGLKGLTMFRDGCARIPILSTSKKSEEDSTEDQGATLKRGEVEPQNNNLIGMKRKLMTGCGSLHVCAFFDPVTNELKECFLNKGSTGGCNNYMIGLSRMISLSARAGVDVETIADQLASTGACPSYAVRKAVHKDTSTGSCCPMAIGNALVDMWKELKSVMSDEELADKYADLKNYDNEHHEGNSHKCPECGAELVFEGGCNTCKNCGWSKCG